MEERRHLEHLSGLQERVYGEWRPWERTLSEVADSLGVDPSRGLDHLDARNRRTHFGGNIPVDHSGQLSIWSVVVGELCEPLVLLLVLVGALYSLWGDAWDAATIFVAIWAVLALGAWTEWRAGRALASLRNSVASNTTVLREGVEGIVSADDVVPGDVIVLRYGQAVPADAVVALSHSLSVDEGALTGESQRVAKTALAGHVESDDVAAGGGSLPSTLLCAGATVATGRAVAIVVATGRYTAIATRLAGTSSAPASRPAPSQQQMARLAGRLSLAAIGASGLLAVVGVLAGGGVAWRHALLMGMGLAFASIPAELPLVARAALALGSRALSRDGLLVRHVDAVDALAAASVIVTDKTGTLTRSRLAVSALMVVGSDAVDVLTPESVWITERSAALAMPLYSAWALSVDPLESRPLAQRLAAICYHSQSVSRGPTVFLGHRSSSFLLRPAPAFEPVRGFGKDCMDSAVLGSLPAADEDASQLLRDSAPALVIADAISALCGCLSEPTGELLFDATQRVSARTRSAATPPTSYSPRRPHGKDPVHVIGSPKHWTVIKGAPEALVPQCTRVWRSSSDLHPLLSAEDICAGRVAGIEPMPDSLSASILRSAAKLAAGGSRVIAYVLAITDTPLYAQTLSADSPVIATLDGPADSPLPGDLIFVGAFAFFDPPQREARPVVQECQDAGMRVILATGDHPSTALAVASAVGIVESHNHPSGAAEVHAVTGEMVQRSLAHQGGSSFDQLIGESNVFARVSPAQKLRLIHALQANGDVVAFIGDGINDAPALSRADIGICMGANPSTADVAMDAAGLIVLEGSFAGVVRSLRESRRLSTNMLKCAEYFLATKLALLMVFAVLLLLVESPMTPVQLVVIKLIADIGATHVILSEHAEGLPVEPGNRSASLGALAHLEYMAGRKGKHAPDLRSVFYYASALFAACILPLLIPSLLLPSWAVAPVAPTLAFLTWISAHSLLGLSMSTRLLPLRISSVPRRLLWPVASLLVIVLVPNAPPLCAHLDVVPLDAAEWAMVGISPLLMFAALECVKELRYRWLVATSL